MSENRSRYSSAPLQDLRRKPPRPEPARTAPNQPGPQPGNFVALQVMLVLVLPLAFFIALLAKNSLLHWAFVLFSLLCLAAMYLLRAFVPNARRVLGVIHTAMIAVMLFTILVSGAPAADKGNQAAQNQQSIFNDNTTASIQEMNENQAAQALKEEAQEANPGAASLAQQKLEQFMSAWGTKDYAAMVSYSAPNWVNQYNSQRDAETGIFHLSAIRTPVSYQILDVSGNDADQTRTITMQAKISKSDGKEPQLYNFQILMIRNNNQWYVDPNSISSSQVVQQEVQAISAEQAAAQAAAQAANQAATTNTSNVQVPQINSVPSNTVLYYNQSGGEFYHLDPNCSSIGSKYKPLKATFYYRDISSETFKNLKTCPHCKAPARP